MPEFYITVLFNLNGIQYNAESNVVCSKQYRNSIQYLSIRDLALFYRVQPRSFFFPFYSIHNRIHNSIHSSTNDSINNSILSINVECESSYALRDTDVWFPVVFFELGYPYIFCSFHILIAVFTIFLQYSYPLHYIFAVSVPS